MYSDFNQKKRGAQQHTTYEKFYRHHVENDSEILKTNIPLKNLQNQNFLITVLLKLPES